MIDIAKVALDPASGADALRQALGVNQVVQLGKIVFFGQKRNKQRSMRDSRFTNRESRMLFAIDQGDADSLLA